MKSVVYDSSSGRITVVISEMRDYALRGGKKKEKNKNKQKKPLHYIDAEMHVFPM